MCNFHWAYIWVLFGQMVEAKLAFSSLFDSAFFALWSNCGFQKCIHYNETHRAGREEKGNLMLESDFESIPANLKRRNWIILGFLLLGSVPFLSWRFSMGVLIGGVLVNLNFHFLHRTLVKTLMVTKTKEGMVAKYLFRLLITGIVILVVLIKSWVNIFGLLLGLSVVVINLTYLALRGTKGIVLK